MSAERTTPRIEIGADVLRNAILSEFDRLRNEADVLRKAREIQEELQERDKRCPIMPGVDEEEAFDRPPQTRRAARKKVDITVDVQFGSDR
jgi:hypothetical protein